MSARHVYATTAEVLAYLRLGEDALREAVTDSEAGGIVVPRLVLRPNLHRWYLDRVDDWLDEVCAWRGSNSVPAAGSSDGGSAEPAATPFARSAHGADRSAGDARTGADEHREATGIDGPWRESLHSRCTLAGGPVSQTLEEVAVQCRGAEADALAQTRRTRELLDETERLRTLLRRARPAVATLAVTLGSNEYPEGKALLTDIDAEVPDDN